MKGRTTDMVTMLDCIRRTAKVADYMFENSVEVTDAVEKLLKDRISEIDEIIMVGSGSSHNAIVTATPFMEKASNLQVHGFFPNTFLNKTVFNKKALYIFASQSGTSKLVTDMIVKANENGLLTLAVTDDANSPIAKEAKAHVSICVNGEEYGYRTVGFCATFLALQLIAMRIGCMNGFLSREAYEAYIADGKKAVKNHPDVVERSLKWFESRKDALKNTRTHIFYGSGDLYGIALEGALKLLEVAKQYMAIGYEQEDGLHGPCLGFVKGDVVIALSDGVRDRELAHSVVRFSKNELGQGYIFGCDVEDETDLAFNICSENFKALEVAPAVEVLSYMMAVINDVPVEPIATRAPHPSSKYFQTHSGR